MISTRYVNEQRNLKIIAGCAQYFILHHALPLAHLECIPQTHLRSETILTNALTDGGMIVIRRASSMLSELTNSNSSAIIYREARTIKKKL